jgi:hypothetical protein
MGARIQPYDYPCRRRWAEDQITSGFEFGLEALEQTGGVNFGAAPDACRASSKLPPVHRKRGAPGHESLLVSLCGIKTILEELFKAGSGFDSVVAIRSVRHAIEA